MRDPDLFAAGVAVTFLFFAGVYVALRERLRQHEEEDEPTSGTTGGAPSTAGGEGPAPR